MPTRAARPRKAAKRPARRPPTDAAGPKYAGVSDAAVRKATGKGWDHWLARLDRFGAADKGHRAAAEHLHALGVPPWWSQMITVGYEQARGLRRKHERPDGFQVSAGKAIPARLEAVWEAWNDPALRAEWLRDDGLEVCSATAGKRMRFSSAKGKDHIEITFAQRVTKRGLVRTQVVAQHGKLATAAAGAKMKRFWGKALDRLHERLAQRT